MILVKQAARISEWRQAALTGFRAFTQVPGQTLHTPDYPHTLAGPFFEEILKFMGSKLNEKDEFRPEKNRTLRNSVIDVEDWK